MLWLQLQIMLRESYSESIGTSFCLLGWRCTSNMRDVGVDQLSLSDLLFQPCEAMNIEESCRQTSRWS